TPASPNAGRFALTDNETERARHWLPCVDQPAVRPTLSFHLRADASLTILANGRLTSEETHDDGTKTAHWELEQNCPSYLTCFGVGEFVKLDQGEYQGRPVAAFAPAPHDEAELERSFGPTLEMLPWLEERLGVKFPFPKYYQLAVPGIGGAMENISLVSWDDRYLLDEALASEMQWLFDIINLHEMSHSYFGDHVVCRDHSHDWLKESWATYMEACWAESKWGEDWMRYALYTDAQAYFQECHERYRRPIVTRTFDHSWSMFDRHLYPGGAWRVHMLRRELGDDSFWAAVTDYLERFGGGTAETSDFRRVLEQHSGRSLARFFDQWLRSPGHPVLKLSFRYDAEAKRGVFELEQTQVDEKAGVGLFDFSIDLAWSIGAQETRRTLSVSEAKTRASFPMDTDPEWLRVDPDQRLLHELEFDPGTTRLVAQLDAADVYGRIQAGLGLCKSGKLRGITAVAEAYADEEFWGVRVEWAKALGDAHTEPAIEALAKIVRTEQDARALFGVMDAAGKQRDLRLNHALVARLAEGLPPRAASAAYRSLGAQREDAPLGVIAKGAGESGTGGFAQAGALAALGACRQFEALGALIDRTRGEDTDARARPAGATALGDLAKTLDKRPRERAVEALEDLLRDADWWVSTAAAAALADAGAPEKADAVVALRARLSAQEQVRVDRTLDRLRRSGAPELTALSKEVERLSEELRKLKLDVETRAQD
ncbi:MAG: hypothetical protein GXP55_24355, partial [Deltaproteobacteria bacterium]|nr:hypothetical protein [Deltaproteobacteria bacterium]